MPRPLLMTSGSLRARRSRASELLIADGVTWSRRAARATLCSASTVSSTTSRFKSSCDNLMDGEYTRHEPSLVEMNSAAYDHRHELDPGVAMKSVTVINRLLIKPGKMDEFIEAQRTFAAALPPCGLVGGCMYRSVDGQSAVLVSKFQSK